MLCVCWFFISINGFAITFADSNGLLASSEITPVMVLVWEKIVEDNRRNKIGNE
jgi:hypothetical protein